MTDSSTRARAPFKVLFSIFVFFFLSGAFALIYEVSWVRALTLEMGSTSLAVSTVVTVFLAGLALGARYFGGIIDRSARPLLYYAVLESVLAVYALLTPFLFRYLLPLFGEIGYQYSEDLFVLSTIRFLATVFFLSLPTFLMGGTLPILTRFWTMNRPDSGRGAGLLYGVNTTGAFIGTAVGGLVFLPHLGLTRTLIVTAFVNLLLGLGAYVLSRSCERSSDRESSPAPDIAEAATPSSDDGNLLPVLLAVAFTGFGALICQVAWTRVLALVLGPSIHAFTIVLSTFLAGLGLGSAAVAALLKAKPERSKLIFFGLATASALLVSVTSAVFQHLPSLFIRLFNALNIRQEVDSVFLIQVSLSFAVMFVPTFIMGGLFPVAARIVTAGSPRAGDAIGRLYAWNTIGSIAGSWATGFVFVPQFGVRGSLLIAVATQVTGGAIITMGNAAAARRAVFSLGSGALIAAMIFATPPWNPQLMTGGVYLDPESYSETSTDDIAKKLRSDYDLLFYKDGLTATITVIKYRLAGPTEISITTNGKVDGSSYGDMATQKLSAHLPMMFHPSPKDVCVVGMGTGITAGSASLYPVNKVDLVEIEAAMVEGARFFAPYNYDVTNNPKVNTTVNDGRLFLKLRPASYDVVISEPSNPWMSGSSNLFTTEYFQIGARALREGGIFCAWIQLYSMSPENFRVILRTFRNVFPYVYLASPIPGTDTVLLGSKSPFAPDLKGIRDRLDRAVLGDLSDWRVQVMNEYDLLARVHIGPDEIPALAGEGILHTDDLPVIAYRAPKDLYNNTLMANWKMLRQHSLGVGPYLDFGQFEGPDRTAAYNAMIQAYIRFLGRGSEALYLQKESMGISSSPDRPASPENTP